MSSISLPEGFAPYNVQNLHGDIYVSYAKQDAAKKHPVIKAGLGYVTLFNAIGRFKKELISIVFYIYFLLLSVALLTIVANVFIDC